MEEFRATRTLFAYLVSDPKYVVTVVTVESHNRNRIFWELTQFCFFVLSAY